VIINEDTEIPNLCQQITKLSTHNGVLDVKEQDKRLAMLFADRCMPYVKFKYKPDMPESLARYKLLAKDKKFLFEKENPNWRDWPTVSDYRDKCSGIDAENDSNVYWLRHWLTLVNVERKKVINSKLSEFLANMPSKPTAKESVTVHEKSDPEVQMVKDIFDGDEIKGGWQAHSRKGIPRNE